MTEAPLLLAVKDDTANVTLNGDLDLDNAEALKTILGEALQANKPIVIDLEHVPDCHTVALQIFIAALKSADKKAIPVTFIGAEPHFSSLCSLAGINHLIDHAQTTEFPTPTVDDVDSSDGVEQ